VVLRFGTFEKVKLYKARHLVEMIIARKGGNLWLSAVAGKALPNDLVFAVSRLAALVSLSLQAVVQSAVPWQRPQGQSRGTNAPFQRSVRPPTLLCA
jgi:hypothetical protein